MLPEIHQQIDTMLRQLLTGERTQKPMSTRTPTAHSEATAAALAALDKLGKRTVQDDSVKFTGTQFVVPESFSNNLPDAAKFLLGIHEQEKKRFQFGRTFPYRPWDGAAAFNRALKRVFGTAGLGKTIPAGMFSPEQPPELRSIQVGVNKSEQVPWGLIEMPPIKATFSLGFGKDKEKGILFHVDVEAPRMYRTQIEGFFDVVQAELETGSIYRGKAFDGAGMPNFLDLSWLDNTPAIYSDEVMTQLAANVWTLIKHTDQVRAAGLPLKRAILLEGPYGTGKSLACALTARLAEENEWTFIQCRPGKDDVFETLKTAELYAPAVVQFEDIDTIAADGDATQISRLLDAMDGIGNKGAGVVCIFTTNNVEKIQKAVMRPGRIDAVIHIGALDKNGVEALVRASIPADRLGKNIDWDAVYAAMQKFLPAFVKEACGRAVRYELARGNGKSGRIETPDIVAAAQGLQRQLDLMNGAHEGPKPLPTLDAQFRNLVRAGVDGTDVLDGDGDQYATLAATGSNAAH